MTERTIEKWVFIAVGAVAGAIGMLLWQDYQRDAACWKDIPGTDRRAWVCAEELAPGGYGPDPRDY